jgi:plastocyanin
MTTMVSIVAALHGISPTLSPPRWLTRRVSARAVAAVVLPLALLPALGCDSKPIGAPSGPLASAGAANVVTVQIRATDSGFEPAEVHLEQGKPGVLVFTRTTDRECVNAVRMPWMDEAVDLPKNQPVTFQVDTSKAGTFSYTCWMTMVFGRVVIDPS